MQSILTAQCWCDNFWDTRTTLFSIIRVGKLFETFYKDLPKWPIFPRLFATVNFHVPKILLKERKNKLIFLVNWRKFDSPCTSISFSFSSCVGEHKSNWKKRP